MSVDIGLLILLTGTEISGLTLIHRPTVSCRWIRNLCCSWLGSLTHLVLDWDIWAGLGLLQVYHRWAGSAEQQERKWKHTCACSGLCLYQIFYCSIGQNKSYGQGQSQSGRISSKDLEDRKTLGPLIQLMCYRLAIFLLSDYSFATCWKFLFVHISAPNTIFQLSSKLLGIQ